MWKVPWLVVMVWGLAAGAAIAHPDDGEEAAALVARLPLDRDVPRGAGDDGRIEMLVAGLGEAAIPALEREMHLGLRGGEAQSFIDSGESRRYAVVRTLGRIPGPLSTAVLIAGVRDYGDFNGLCDSIVDELRSRTLTAPERELLLTSASPSAILFALGNSDTIGPESPLRAVATDLFDPERVRGQVQSGTGQSIGGEETRWEIHLAAGRALGRDMAPEIRDRAAGLVGDLLAVPDGGWKGTGRSDRGEYMSGPEFEVDLAIRSLVRLGTPAFAVVERARRTAAGDGARVLDLALLSFGDTERLDAVHEMLNDSPHGSLRLCAAMVLRRTRDSRTRDAWWKAMDDPLCVPARGCVRIPGRERVYPVRQIAAQALILLGEPPEALRARLVPPGPAVPALRVWTIAGMGAVALLLGLGAWTVRARRRRVP